MTPWTVAYQAPLSMGFARQEYWSGVPLPSPSEMVAIADAGLFQLKVSQNVESKEGRRGWDGQGVFLWLSSNRRNILMSLLETGWVAEAK